MANSMIAVTADGSQFGCAAISLTETGVAVLNDGGSRIGFVPYGTLNYVVPSAEATGEGEASMTVVAGDGAAFGCASISQTSKGVATLNQSGSRTGFVPYDTLQHVLPPEKANAELPDGLSLPAGVSGESDDESVWGDADDSESKDEKSGSSEASGSDESGSGESGNDESGSSESGSGDSGSGGSGSDDGSGDDGIWDDANESAQKSGSGSDPDPDSDVVEEDLDADEDRTSNDADGGIVEADDEGPGTDPTDTEGSASGEASAAADAESGSGSGDEEREEAGESELKVEWSFGEYDE